MAVAWIAVSGGGVGEGGRGGPVPENDFAWRRRCEAGAGSVGADALEMGWGAANFADHDVSSMGMAGGFRRMAASDSLSKVWMMIIVPRWQALHRRQSSRGGESD